MDRTILAFAALALALAAAFPAASAKASGSFAGARPGQVLNVHVDRPIGVA